MNNTSLGNNEETLWCNFGFDLGVRLPAEMDQNVNSMMHGQFTKVSVKKADTISGFSSRYFVVRLT